MAHIRKELLVEAPAAAVWEAFRDVGAVHTRLAPGFVIGCRLEEDAQARVVTFANGFVATELIVDVDDAARRLAYSASERLAHHSASFQLHEEGADRTRIVWLADVLPHGAAQTVAAMMEEGCKAMRRALE